MIWYININDTSELVKMLQEATPSILHHGPHYRLLLGMHGHVDKASPSATPHHSPNDRHLLLFNNHNLQVSRKYHFLIRKGKLV